MSTPGQPGSPEQTPINHSPKENTKPESQKPKRKLSTLLFERLASWRKAKGADVATTTPDNASRSQGERAKTKHPETDQDETLHQLSQVAATYERMTKYDPETKYGSGTTEQQAFLFLVEATRAMGEYNPQAIERALAIAPKIQRPFSFSTVPDFMKAQALPGQTLRTLLVQQQFHCSGAEAEKLMTQQEKAIAARRSELENTAAAIQREIVDAFITRDLKKAAETSQRYASVMSDFRNWNEHLQKTGISSILDIKTTILGDRIELATNEEASQVRATLDEWNTNLLQKAFAETPNMTRDTPAPFGENVTPVISADGISGVILNDGITYHGGRFWNHFNASIDESNITIRTPDGKGIGLDDLRTEALLMLASQEGRLRVGIRIDLPFEEGSISLGTDDQGKWKVRKTAKHDPNKDDYTYAWHDGVRKGYRDMTEQEAEEVLGHYSGIAEAIKPRK